MNELCDRCYFINQHQDLRINYGDITGHNQSKKCVQEGTKQYTTIIIHIMVHIVYFVHKTMYVSCTTCNPNNLWRWYPWCGCWLPSSGYFLNYTKEDTLPCCSE